MHRSQPIGGRPSASPTDWSGFRQASRTSTISWKTSSRRSTRCNASVIDFVLHFDKHLLDFVREYGWWVYGLLFTIVFAETGFVVTPFLPGDSLLFAAGALCATGVLSTPALLALLVFAAFAGNTVNYSVGRFIGPRVFKGSDPMFGSDRVSRLLNKEYLDRAHAFFEKY